MPCSAAAKQRLSAHRRGQRLSVRRRAPPRAAPARCRGWSVASRRCRLQAETSPVSALAAAACAATHCSPAVCSRDIAGAQSEDKPLTSTEIINREWLRYVLVLLLVFLAIFMLLTRISNQGKPIDELMVKAPPTMNTMEQILAVQNAISQLEELVQDGNIILLKLRALLLAVPTEATNKAIFILVLIALTVALLPIKFILLMAFLEIFTRDSPPRRGSTEKLTRRFREWWFSIPAAHLIVEATEEKKEK